MKKIVYLVLVLVMFTACKINNKQNNIVTDDTDVVELVENETDDVETVDNTTEEIETVVSLGDWKEGYYKDEFGEDTNVKLAFQEVKGKYSEPDTDESSNMTAEIIVDAEDVLFRLKWLTTYESNADDIIFRIKDDNNIVSEFNMKANKSGYVKPNTDRYPPLLFYKAFQHFFHPLQKSVRRPSCKKSIVSQKEYDFGSQKGTRVNQSHQPAHLIISAE